ncbi:MAG: CHAT domain-containing protein [Planctomycetes bacterium]|nr:CHAT domain-containing protein [Planctomycetota bacterium]
MRALERLELEQPFLSYYFWQIGGAQMEAARPLVAIDTYQRGIAKATQPNVYAAAMKVDLAAVLIGEGCWRDAKQLLTEAEPELGAVDATEVERFYRTETVAHWFGIQGEIDLQLGLPDRAATRFQREAEAAREAWQIQQTAFPNEFSASRWDALRHRFHLALASSDFASVDALLEKSRTDPLYPDWTPSLDAEFAVLAGAARYELERRGKPVVDDAEATLEAAAANSAARSIDKEQALMLLAKLQIESGNWEAARELVDELRRLHPQWPTPRCGSNPTSITVDAYDARVRYESATDDTTRRSVLEDFERSFEVFLRAWSDAPDRDAGIAFLRYGERALVLDELLRMCLAVDGPEVGAKRALQWLGNAQLLGSLATHWQLARKPVDEWLAPLVVDGAGVLFVQSGRQQSTLFVVDAAGIVTRPLAADWQIATQVGALRGAVARAVRAQGDGSAPPVDEARALADLVLPADLRPRVAGWSHAWAIGVESLGTLAFELVPLADGRRLGDVLPISYVPSLPVAAELATRARVRGAEPESATKAAVLAAPSVVPAVASKWKSSALTIDDAVFEPWADAWGGRFESWIGAAATANALCEAGANGVDALQVVVHGIEDVTRESAAGLLLAGAQGEFWTDALRGPTPRLVLLAACQIDDRPVRIGDDGRAGWAGRFAIEGSDCVVLTPVDLELKRALAFFEIVQRSLARGRAPAAALVDARRELAKSGARAQDYLIYAWGAGVQPIVAAPATPVTADTNAAGAATEAATPAFEMRWILIGGVVLVVFVVGGIVARRRS